MSPPGQYRAKAAEYAELAKAADSPEAVQELQKLGQSFGVLADNEQWLSEHYDETVHASANADAGKLASAVNGLALAVEEEHVLRCLGAAVIMRWNALPTKLQRELFDAAGSSGEILETAGLRRQIALFLHKHKDDK